MFSAKDQHQATALADALHAAGFENRWRREVRKIMREMLDKNDNDWERIMPGLWRKLSRHADSTKLIRAAVEIAAETVSKEVPSFTGIIDNSEPVNVTEHTRHYPRGASVHTVTSVPGTGAPTEAQKAAERAVAKEYADRIYFTVIHGRDIREVTFGEIAQIVQSMPILQQILGFAANWTPNQRVRDVIKDSELMEIINGAA